MYPEDRMRALVTNFLCSSMKSQDIKTVGRGMVKKKKQKKERKERERSTSRNAALGSLWSALR